MPQFLPLVIPKLTVTGVFTGLLCLFATMAHVRPAMAAGKGIQVEALRPQLVYFYDDDPVAAGLELTLDIRFTNQSDGLESIPDLKAGVEGAAWIEFIGVLAPRPDGAWRYVVDPGLSVWPGDTKFAACVPLLPSATADVSRVKNRFVILRKTLADLGPQPTVRLTLALVCQQADGEVATKELVSDPFVVSIPARP